MSNNSVGNFLAELRKEKGITQKELAEFLNVSDKTVSHWECDKYSPDISVIPILAEYFGVTCDEILKGERKQVSYDNNNFSYEPIGTQTEYQKYSVKRLQNAYAKLKTSNVIAVFVSAFVLAFLVIIVFIINFYIPIELGILVAAVFSTCLGILITYIAYQKFISVLNFCDLKEEEVRRWKKKARRVCLFPIIYAIVIFLSMTLILLNALRLAPVKLIEGQHTAETLPPVSIEAEGSTENLGDTSEPYMVVPTMPVTE